MARLLIVEDNIEMLEILKRALETKDHNVVIASGGEAGLEAFNKQQFDIVVTDIVMPGVDGLAFVKAIRNMDKSTKIMAISGGSKEMDASYALNVADIYGADVEIYKPFSLDDFMEMVDALLVTE